MTGNQAPAAAAVLRVRVVFVAGAFGIAAVLLARAGLVAAFSLVAGLATAAAAAFVLRRALAVFAGAAGEAAVFAVRFPAALEDLAAIIGLLSTAATLRALLVRLAAGFASAAGALPVRFGTAAAFFSVAFALGVLAALALTGLVLAAPALLVRRVAAVSFVAGFAAAPRLVGFGSAPLPADFLDTRAANGCA